MKTKIFLVLFIIITTFFTTSCHKTIEVEKHSDDRYTTVVDDKTRTFYIKTPSNYDKNSEYPIMFYLHAAGQTAFEVTSKGFTEKATELGFFVVYPGASLGSWKLYNSSDTEFISSILDYMVNNYSIDEKSIFSTGFSLGGFMSMKLAFEIPEKISAISVIGGSIFPEHLPENPSPLSVQHIHALDDNGILYNGTQGQVLSIPESIEFWNGVNEIVEGPMMIYDEKGVKAERWISKESEEVVELITYETGGHNLLPNSPDLVIDFFNRIKNNTFHTEP